MSGKHRGPSRAQATTRISRLTLDAATSDALLALIDREQRSFANMISVLVTEAIRTRQRRMKRRSPTYAAWIRCPSCEDFWCTIHRQHVYDCACPPIEEWMSRDPYASGGRRPPTAFH